MYQTDSLILGRAVAAGLAAAAVIGGTWGFLIDAGLGGRGGVDWSFWFCLLLGFGVAESVSYAAKRRRGSTLQALAIGMVALGFAISRVVINARLARPVSLDAFLRQPLDVGQGLRVDLLTLLFVVMAGVIAWRRFR